jgi:hypothetical protein
MVLQQLVLLSYDSPPGECCIYSFQGHYSYCGTAGKARTAISKTALDTRLVKELIGMPSINILTMTKLNHCLVQLTTRGLNKFLLKGVTCFRWFEQTEYHLTDWVGLVWFLSIVLHS